MPPRETITPMGVPVDVYAKNVKDAHFISLTDIAKYKNEENPADIIKNWIRTRSTIEYIGLWEEMNNRDFNSIAFNELKLESGSNSFVLSPTKWIEKTNAIGITTQAGRYGGTYAHSDIAFEFASWISAEFKLYLIKDYQQLKQKENSHFNLEWNLNRTMAKLNYKVHTDAIKDNLIPPAITKAYAGVKYANEADRLNVALFGKTAKEWRQENPDAEGNIRDAATIEQLLVLTNLESMNAELIKQKISEEERTLRLNIMAREQMEVFLNNQEATRRLENNLK
ncbi:KilA-N domain-containing protein [Jeotgalibaca caeni]|uniref:KilA-N domain-containing protein n=1 Tax=Jeotgalibaca caeni TaxID=3028623 RepID=UPI00237ED781|nr:KilA-N domain-containing protein [Jeotgalibaca caeni]